MQKGKTLQRRDFLRATSALASTTAAGLVLPRGMMGAPAIIAADSARPQLAHGIQIGDVGPHNAIIWSRSDRPSRMIVEWDTSEAFKNPRKLRGPYALATSDYTARLDLVDLPPSEEIFLRVYAQGLDSDRIISAPEIGSFMTGPWAKSDVRFVWGGDTAGQGYGINPDFGGMRIYETMRQRRPHFFIHNGDTIYADGPIQAEVTVEDGKIWRNLVTEEKSKVAESIDEFRGAYRYNLLDENVKRFNAEVPQIWQWDDHEITNNWSDSKVLDDRYTLKDVPQLIANGTKAFLEYAPMRPYSAEESERVYRQIPYGPLLDTFVIDMRSYRGPNTHNRQELPNDETTFLDREQLHWLKAGLLQSQATWKVIASDMPIGLLVRDGTDEEGRPRFENMANGDGPPLGRELEMQSLLKFIKHNNIKNVVWLTADVHYCAAHYYDPNKAQFSDFDGFWEFVAGPLNAGSFGPNDMDNTFGPQVVFEKAPPAANYSPLGGFQFFGQVDIDAKDQSMKVSLVDLDGQTVFEKVLEDQSKGSCGWKRNGR